MTESRQIAILIPTYGRSDRISRVVKNIHDNTTVSHRVYFIVESQDIASQKAIELINEQFIINIGLQYVGAINTGYRSTDEPFILCAADDLDFKKGWDIELLSMFDDPELGVSGAMDSWEISQSGFHASHLFIRRSYIQQYSGVEDEKDVIYSSKYIHTMCDIETEQTAIKRGAFKVCKTARIEHNHWFNGKATKDITYERCQASSDRDKQVYDARRQKFEQYYFERLFHGQIYRVNQGKLSIVIASYNELDYLQRTIESIYENTYSDFELIVVDDCSNSQVRSYIKGLIRPCIRIFNEKQQFTNGCWNIGVGFATGDYIAVVNNDVTFSRHWDVYLMNALNRPEVQLVGPYQTDDGCRTPYGKDERAGNIDIRGAAFMFKRENQNKMFPIPADLKMWFGDSWIARQVVQVHKKQSVFVPEAVIHHFGSKSSSELQDQQKILWWIIRGDIYAYRSLTGEPVDRLVKLVEDKVQSS